MAAAAAVVVQQLALSSLMWYFIKCSDDFHGTIVLAHVVSMIFSFPKINWLLSHFLINTDEERCLSTLYQFM